MATRQNEIGIPSELEQNLLETKLVDETRDLLLSYKKESIPVDLVVGELIHMVTQSFVDLRYTDYVCELDDLLLKKIVKAVRCEGLNRSQYAVLEKIRNLAVENLHDEKFNLKEQYILELEIVEGLSLAHQYEKVYEKFHLKRSAMHAIKSDAYAILAEIVDEHLTNKDRKVLPVLRKRVYGKPTQEIAKNPKYKREKLERRIV